MFTNKTAAQNFLQKCATATNFKSPEQGLPSLNYCGSESPRAFLKVTPVPRSPTFPHRKGGRTHRAPLGSNSQPRKVPGLGKHPECSPPGLGPRAAAFPPRLPRTRRASPTVALGPDEQGHALQPLHVAGGHMASAPVVPLPVLVERVDLHPPPGVGHRGGRGPRPSGPGTVSRKGGRPQTGNSGPSVPPLAAAELRRRSHGPLPGPSPGPPPSLAAPLAPRRYCPGRVSAAARQPRRGRAALSCLPARRSHKG